MGEHAAAATAARDPGQMTGLRIADDLHLPADVVTQTTAIVGRRGSGKTSTATVLTEELIRAGLPVVVLDPLGVWHGLRSSADGHGPGLPVVIFGGDHADVPLQPGTGALVADVIVDQRPPAVIDLSGLESDAEIRRWCAAFLRRLYKRNRSALHVAFWQGKLGKAERAVLAAVLDVWPESISVDKLAEETGYSRTSSSLSNAVSKLRTLELASGGAAAITANDELGEANRG